MDKDQVAKEITLAVQAMFELIKRKGVIVDEVECKFILQNFEDTFTCVVQKDD